MLRGSELENIAGVPRLAHYKGGSVFAGGYQLPEHKLCVSPHRYIAPRDSR